MNPDRWSRLSSLFDAALDLPHDERERYVADHCAGDDELALSLRRMLAADAQVESAEFLDRPAITDARLWADALDDTYAPGSRRFGAYRLLKLIGRGGMGEVHLAERSDGEFEQRVALKLLPQPTPGLMQRFRQERQILARLEHPSIARLIDGGVGENHVPYFAMEYVDGVPITVFVAARKLEIAAALQLFLGVCDAVQYAHRNLVVHRDLKPSNILVDALGTPKLLDFGIAKVLQETGGEATRTNVRVFTPDYAAPEQIRGEPVTTATDVYALGIVLYELLTGARPYKITRDVLPEQAILSAEARAPSAAVRGDKARQRALRGDLDTILLHAIAKQPERRYATADALAADIRRHLDGLPITTRGESTGYRARKFVARHRTGVVAALIIAVALITATAISLHQARIATIEAARAEQKSRTTDAVKDYLLSVFASANPYKTDGEVVTARDLLEGGLAQVEKKLDGQLQVQAEIYAGLVNTFFQLNKLALGKRAAQLALDKYRQFLPADSLEILRTETNIAQADFYLTQFDGLAPRFENLLARLGDRGGDFLDVRTDALTLLAMTQFRIGRYEQSIRASEDVLALLRKTRAKDYDYDINIVLYNEYLARMAEGRFSESGALVNEFATQDRLLVGPQHPGLYTDVVAIARLLQDVGRLHEARELYTAALAARRRQFPETHPFVINIRSYLASIEVESGFAGASEATWEELIATLASPNVEMAATDISRIHFYHALSLLALGRLDDARHALDAAHEQIMRVTDAEGPAALTIDAVSTDAERVAGKPEHALALVEPIIQHQRERADRELPASLLVAARASAAVGKPGDALAALSEARDMLERQGRPFSSLAREVEMAWATLPPGVSTTQTAATHWLRAARIGCVNFGCTDARVVEWRRLANVASSGSATTIEKPFEAQYQLALDILTKANSAAVPRTP